jgi:hypothetical protein
MLCYLRFPGRVLHVGERPPAPLLVFVADQIEALPDCIDEYLATDRNCDAPCAALSGSTRGGRQESLPAFPIATV